MKGYTNLALGALLLHSAAFAQGQPAVTINGPNDKAASSEAKIEAANGYTVISDSKKTVAKDGVALTVHLYIEMETRALHRGKGTHTFHVHMNMPMFFRSDGHDLHVRA